MKRMAVMLALTLAVGIALGMLGNRLLSAAQEPIKRAVLLKTDLAGCEGKEAVVFLSEIAPGATAGKHYHSGDEVVYLLEGSRVVEVEGKPPITFKAGDTYYNPPKVVHRGINPSTTAPSKALAFGIFEKGQPLTTPVQ